MKDGIDNFNEEFYENIKRVFLIKKLISKRVRLPFSGALLTKNEVLILFLLYISKDHSNDVQELINILDLSKSQFSKLTKSLRDKKMITTKYNQKNKNFLILQLTKLGETLLKEQYKEITDIKKLVFN
ncbi:MarR family winged helix-turn-helix transcriptional regulator [Liquorilactobacillus cacaonum]|uniref:HTH marR-type domain-containing protein n=1 Tax=Liquorilactobacillus cacaonum DSM 21116 TaxID=1423729 RepID=A0A0R2CDY0_9LACO|nr:MarR family winged helix-turn-helix transcriptional regulator [Liquorilactobacillus cacaonum]KRM89967.1 hypothetical protein FC80_GL001789 [Liquorilactobacillus cacaonum DSM 21116]